ncbi:MAG: hypothetical protein A2W01_08930 [Candidatus Solincola sediminis]|uniref:Uncharacterized protein n=1 Tax=Candidatus Solincola sediminis TaxID=1797199 RepID=A0A1F2WR83_9ACTN|nr:MAG: hypothetical protein A2Y75_11130 [Candidatus Solincola sediminis]OFW60247.1 MAG: hypothetical protein A2W01_08930 [Candidatus Solincola sediminis]
MSEVIVVGAGLSGLTAAINCARAGHQVMVLERFKEVGGLPRVHPAVDATPMEPEALGRFIGVELKEPQVRPTESVGMHIYGKCWDYPGSAMFLHNIERGSRPTALDYQLWEIAKAEGVKFEFNSEFKTKDAAWLPPDSIIATGLFFEAFSDMDIPYVQLYGWVARGKKDGPTRVAGYMDTYTRDYCYYANNNGVTFGLAFGTKPVDKSLKERWMEQLATEEDVIFSAWEEHEGVAPIKRFNNPRLFWGDKILAGTFAGMQDPFFLFGVHGALVSGKIAAMAVDDKAQAYEMFTRLTRSFKYSLAVKRLVLYTLPHPLRKLALRTLIGQWSQHLDSLGFIMDIALLSVPGMKKI